MKDTFSLTPKQSMALAQASKTRPIYAEDPRFEGAQTPSGDPAVSLRTVRSLVKLGLLRADDRGGYLLTDEGAALGGY